MQLIWRRALESLYFARRPADHGFINMRIFAQAEMQPPVILRGKSAAAGHFLDLLLAIPEQCDLRADRAPVTCGSFQFEFDPLIFWRDGVLVKKQRAVLIGDDNVEHAAIP